MKRASEYGWDLGQMARGPRNRITDVKGVKVGHCTVEGEGQRTGVTVILPSAKNLFVHKPVAGVKVLNGFGKTAGLMQIEELGTIETPIALTSTLNVGKVANGIVAYMLDRCKAEGVECRSINPVVGECNDAPFSENTERAVGESHVRAAIAAATEDFALGAVGAGRGTLCHGFKGGIGSASRVMTLGGTTYTLGVLAQTNHGTRQDLLIDGRRPFAQKPSAACDKGSCMLIMATDLPLLDRQIRRILMRGSLGLARLGSFMGHGSGDICIGFTTANEMPLEGEPQPFRVLQEADLETPFRAMVECVQEAVLDSMLLSKGEINREGQYIQGLAEALEGLAR